MERSTEERGTEERLMDQYLKSKGLHRSKVAKDGSCLFRAVAEQVLHCQSRHTEVRAKCVEFLKKNRDSYEAFIEGDFEDYLLKLQDPQQWVGEVEINALAVMYKRDFLIFQEPGKPAVNITDKNFKETVQLCFLNGNHYDSVYPISRVKNAAVCQSVLYELLYENVFKVDRSSLGVCQRSSRFNDLLSDDNMAACVSSDESDLDGNEPIWVENETSTTAPRYRGRGRGRQLPERVRRSLNPTLFRNVEYDIWHKTKRAQQRMDYSVAVGMQYSVGDRCQVRLEGGGRIYNAIIREQQHSNRDLVTVYIDELGKIRQVPLWNLRAPSEESSWSTVSRDKRLSNGHGDWEERGRGGRGRGKPAVATATAPGSGGRMVKQHSWPPQAPTEEQGGPRPRQKSVSSADCGLTEKQRTAKDEEEEKELNVALLAIELRDEHSFPALGAQTGVPGEAGRKKGVDKKRSLRNKTKSPVEDIRASSPSAGERPKSSTPPPATTAAPAAPPANTPTPNDPTPPPLPPAAVKLPPAAPPSSSDSGSAWLSSLKAPTANMNVSFSTTSTTVAPPPVSSSTSFYAAPTDKTSALSYASAVGAPLSSKPLSVPSSATFFSHLPSAFPAASPPPIPPALSSPSPPPPTSSSSSSSPSSSLPPPTFIAPIAPSPFAAQGFLSRSSPPVSSFLPHSPSPPLFPSSAQSTSFSSFTHPPPQVHEAPAAAVKTSNSLPNIGGPLTAPQTLQNLPSLSQIHPQVSLPQNQSQISVSHIQTQSQASLPQNHISLPQMQTEVQSAPHQHQHQHQPQSQTEMASVPLNQMQASLSQPQSQAQYPPQSQFSYPHHAQPSVPISASMQAQQHLPAQPPHPSQVPHPSLSNSPPHPPLQTQTPDAQNQTEAPSTPTQPESQPPPSPPSHHPQLHSAPLPLPLLHPTSIPGGVPVQQLSQLYQDLLYPGFPQGEKGDVAMNPQFSKSKSGADLPQDVNVLRFFFNLGLKAYTMPMFQPYMYLLPLQHAYTMQPKLPSRSPSPTPNYPPPIPSPSHQEVFTHPLPYSPTSASVAPQYEPHVASQAQTPEPPHPSEPAQNLSGYPVTQPPPSRIPWPQHQLPPPRNSSFPVSYPAPSPPYPTMPTSTQGYHPGQGSRLTMFPQSMPHYSSSSLGYPSSATPEEHQMRHRQMEQIHPGNGGPMPGHGPSRVPGPLEASAAADMATANSSRVMVAPGASGFGMKKEQGENLTPVLLVDPPINNRPIVTWVSDPEVRESSVSMKTMQTASSTSGSPGRYDVTSRRSVVLSDNNPTRVYRGHQHKTANHSKPYPPVEPGFLVTVTMPEPLSIGCSTEDGWEGSEGYRLSNQRGRKIYRGGGGGGGGRGRGGGGGGGGGRGGGGGGGGQRRRQMGDAGAGLQFSSSQHGRGRGY
ncbi:OTU domain-containing protein 4 [Scomber scombrus]|uniref:OTU domain-containing protein 4 n=1 Tax=Scomber scombrus TaxID=13677 RepID=UPI002DD84264|nr:OTU domain-containing protein 4 [Scomber scombrus]